jgi:AcrR family transcriptional regulator
VDQALRTIAAQGVEALTLRGVGQALGVSRTALYRHFADKAELLATVATEGFRRLRGELTRAWDDAGRGRPGFEAQGRAYVRFAVENPAYYRVMFGRFVDTGGQYPQLDAEAAGAFGALVASLVEQQQMGIVLAGDPMPLARFVWATVHGVATLAIDGRIGDARAIAALTAFAIERIEAGIDRRPGRTERLARPRRPAEGGDGTREGPRRDDRLDI